VHGVLLGDNFFTPIVNGVAYVISLINVPVQNLGLSLIIFAALFRLLFWSLNTAQFKTMLGMQKIGPKLKQLQTQFKGDPQRLQQEQMKLYKEAGVNPMAGCLPLLIQMPVLFSVYWAVRNNAAAYSLTHFLWIGSPLSERFPQWLAVNLAAPDLVLLVIYIISMYVSMRYTSMPSTDPQQAQTQKIMAIMSPMMIAWFGFKAKWPSALILYWIALNAFTMAQTLYLLRRYHQPLSALDSEHAIVDNAPAQTAPASANAAKPSSNGAQSRRARKRNKR